jgi:GNAT superfamily N-acetyltransferase
MELCAADNSHSIYVAEVDGVVQGYAAVHWCPYLMMAGPEGYVSELFVNEAARDQGICARLLETIVEDGRTRGCSRLGLLNLRSRESYKRNFYKDHGWVEREEVANFIFKLMP